MEKRYYWLKLSDDFFTDKAIRKLRNMAGGDTYTIIYLKMLLFAIKQDNRLYYDGIEATFSDEIALEIEEDPDNVKMTLAYLKSKGLVEEISESEVELIQCDEMVGSETDAARRKRVSRQRQKEREVIEVIEKALVEEKPKAKKTESCVDLYERIVDDFDLDVVTKEKMHEWVEYKVERRDPYKERGMRSLLKKVKEMTNAYGINVVCKLIDECMSNNWKGIIWDRLEKGKRSSNYVSKIETRVSGVDDW